MRSTLHSPAENEVSRSALAAVTARACLGFVLGVLPVAAATAQDWSELETLTFTPIVVERDSIGVTAATADRVPNERSGPDDGVAERVIARIDEALDAIQVEQAENGEYSPTLIPLYRALSDIYLEIEGYSDAISVLELAQSVVRRNLGLYSLDQAALIEEMIEIDMAVAPSEQSLEREVYLRELVQRNPADTRNVAILTRMAGRQMAVVEHVLINGIDPELMLNAGVVAGPRPWLSGSPTASSVAASMLRASRRSYHDAMQQSLASGEAALPQLFELEDSIIDTYYFELMNPRLRNRGGAYSRGGGLNYGGGLAVLEAQLRNIRRFSGTPEAVAAATLEIADWQLMFGQFGEAMRIYEETLADLRAASVDEARIAAMFSPEAPVPLPAVANNTNVFDDLGNVHGFVDVEIEINRFGGVRKVVVTGSSATATPAIEKRLRRFVFKNRFRPRHVDGEWLSSDRFTLRYEFGYRAT